MFKILIISPWLNKGNSHPGQYRKRNARQTCTFRKGIGMYVQCRDHPEDDQVLHRRCEVKRHLTAKRSACEKIASISLKTFFKTYKNHPG